MRGIYLSQGIFLAPSKISGNGVFAAQSFSPDELIELCPVIVIPASERSDLDKTILYNHYYEWDESAAALAQGFGSFYNHSYSPNAIYKVDIPKGIINVSAFRNIVRGEEITINYNRTPDSKKAVWFETNNI
jgi:SET domain-containing protein